jgi:hypothetical protein
MLDAQILWQVLLLRYSLFVRDRIVVILNSTELDVANQIRGALSSEAGLRDMSRAADVERLVQRLVDLRRVAWDQCTLIAEEELTNLSRVEIDHQDDLYGMWLPSLRKPLWLVAAPTALALPFQGRVLRQWVADTAADDAKRIRTAIFGGVGQGMRPDAVARLVVGSARARGGDGVTQISRNHIDTVVRSGVVHVSAWTRDQFFRLNPQVLDLEQFVAILDLATTKLCRGLNGNRYPIGTAWIRKQSRAVQVELMGATRVQRMRAGTFDPGKFTDYGSKPMSLEKIVAAAKRLMGERV